MRGGRGWGGGGGGGADRPGGAGPRRTGDHDGAVRARGKETARVPAAKNTGQSTAADGRRRRPAGRVAGHLRAASPHRARRSHVLARRLISGLTDSKASGRPRKAPLPEGEGGGNAYCAGRSSVSTRRKCSQWAGGWT